MKSHRKELWFEVPGRRGFVNITPEVEAEIKSFPRGFVRRERVGVSCSCHRVLR